MRNIARFIVVLAVTAPAYAAIDETPVLPRSESPIVTPQESPQIKSAVVQGTIESLDTVFQRLTVRSRDGRVQEFALGTTTPLTNDSAPIGFRDLRPGDPVSVSFNIRPFQ